MSSDIILCGVFVIVQLARALVQEIVAQQASRQRLEQELHLALTLMLATRPVTCQSTVPVPAPPACRPTT